MSKLVAVGIVRAPHGIRGRLKVEPLTDDPARFTKLRSVMVEQSGPNTGPADYEIEKVAFQPGCVLLELKGVRSREEADSLRGARLLIPEEAVPPAGENSYYFYQLEGMRVETADGELLGSLDFITRTGSNDIYVVVPPGGGEQILIPAVKQAILNVELEKRLMVVDKDWAL